MLLQVKVMLAQGLLTNQTMLCSSINQCTTPGFFCRTCIRVTQEGLVALRHVNSHSGRWLHVRLAVFSETSLLRKTCKCGTGSIQELSPCRLPGIIGPAVRL